MPTQVDWPRPTAVVWKTCKAKSRWTWTTCLKSNVWSFKPKHHIVPPSYIWRKLLHEWLHPKKWHKFEGNISHFCQRSRLWQKRYGTCIRNVEVTTCLYSHMKLPLRLTASYVNVPDRETIPIRPGLWIYPGIIPILHSPGLMIPGQFGPISRVLVCLLRAAFTLTWIITILLTSVSDSRQISKEYHQFIWMTNLSQHLEMQSTLLRYIHRNYIHSQNITWEIFQKTLSYIPADPIMHLTVGHIIKCNIQIANI